MSSPNARMFRYFRASRSWLASCALLLFVFSSGCDIPGRPRAADRIQAAQDEQSFDVLYRRNCAGCHGAAGKLGPAPPLNDKLFLAIVPDDELKRVVSEGRPGTLMPGLPPTRGASFRPSRSGSRGRHQDALGVERACSGGDSSVST